MDILAVFGTLLLAFLARRLIWLFSKPWCDYRTHIQRLPADAFSGKVCWVTGASSGIGAALVRELAARGAYIIVSSRRADALKELTDQLSCTPDRVAIIPFNLTDSSAEDLQTVTNQAIAAFDGRLDYLFNNAGASIRARARDFHPHNLEQVIRLNFVAPAILSHLCMPALLRSKGVIVNTSSVSSLLPLPMRSAYCASKAAISTWHECLRTEEFGNISVVNVCPGYVRTNIARNAFVGEKGQHRQTSDANIDGGLPVEYVAERMLAAAHGRLHSSWIAKGKGLYASYLFYYFPALWPVAAPYVARISTASSRESSSPSADSSASVT